MNIFSVVILCASFKSIIRRLRIESIERITHDSHKIGYRPGDKRVIEAISLSPAGQAALLVGVVLVEAVAFYLGYGAVERRVAPPIIQRIRNA